MGVVKGILDYLEPSDHNNYHHQNSGPSPDFDIISNQVPNERLETLKKGNFLRSISLTPNTIDTYGMSTPNPIISTPSSYVSTPSPHISSSPGLHVSTPGPHISTPGPQFSTPGPPYNPTPNPQIQFTTPTPAAPAIQYSTTPAAPYNNNNNFVNMQTGPPIGGMHNHNVFYTGSPTTTPAPHRPMVNIIYNN